MSEEIRPETTLYATDRVSVLQQPNCGDCGYVLEEVRPGKHQCSYCDLVREVESLQSTIREGYPLAKQVVATCCAEICDAWAAKIIKKEFGL